MAYLNAAHNPKGPMGPLPGQPLTASLLEAMLKDPNNPLAKEYQAAIQIAAYLHAHHHEEKLFLNHLAQQQEHQQEIIHDEEEAWHEKEVYDKQMAAYLAQCQAEQNNVVLMAKTDDVFPIVEKEIAERLIVLACHFNQLHAEEKNIDLQGKEMKKTYVEEISEKMKEFGIDIAESEAFQEFQERISNTLLPHQVLASPTLVHIKEIVDARTQAALEKIEAKQRKAGASEADILHNKLQNTIAATKAAEEPIVQQSALNNELITRTFCVDLLNDPEAESNLCALLNLPAFQNKGKTALHLLDILYSPQRFMKNLQERHNAYTENKLRHEHAIEEKYNALMKYINDRPAVRSKYDSLTTNGSKKATY